MVRLLHPRLVGTDAILGCHSACAVLHPLALLHLLSTHLGGRGHLVPVHGDWDHLTQGLPPPPLPPASFLYWSNHLELHTLLIFSSSAFPLGGEGALFLFFLNANPCFSQLSSSVLISAFIGFRQWVLWLHCCGARIHPLCNGVHCTTWAAPSGCGDSRGAAASPQAPIAAAAPQLLTDIRKLPGESSYQITAVSTVLIARGAVR